ncbi:trace amine-associated receptor 1-like [Scleropages formosus]|uniref:trace amine-associated receptor 1-like n=1 Tax=Scleropages formosus TaxID=113540 RepID=UPI0008782745|nr:trace amine-associated receptor 1-like [Scleropages formosus]
MNTSHFGTHENVLLCYESSNKSCPKHAYSVVVRAPLYILLGAVIIVTVFGNLLVIIAIVHLKQLHTPTNYLVLSLAMADFLVGVVIMPPSMVRSLETCWYLGNLFYRYYAVCNPLQYQTRITTSAVVTMIMISWILSAVFGFGMIFLQLNILGLEDIYYQQFYCEGGCFVIQSKIASSVSSVLSFYNPGFIILSIYLKIFLIARRQVYSIQKSACLKRNSARAGDFSSKSEQKATKTLGIVVGVFLCCWTPFFVCNTVNSVFGYDTPLLLEVLVWIGYTNSGLNPVIYAFFYKWFRRAFRITLEKMFKTQGNWLCSPVL